MKYFIYISLIVLLFSCSGKNSKSTNQEITVFSAASLTDVITEIADEFTKETSVKVKLNLAASGTLARQIEQGAGADIYLSANKKWMDYLIEKTGTIKDSILLRNELVLISPKESEIEIGDAKEFLANTKEKLAIGDPGYVPAGKYADQVFQNWELNLKEEQKFLTKDVRTALMMVELGEAKLGIVYKTDAIRSEKVKIVYTFPEDSHKPISYYAAQLSEKVNSEIFFEFLYSEKAQKLMNKYQFILN